MENGRRLEADGFSKEVWTKMLGTDGGKFPWTHCQAALIAMVIVAEPYDQQR